MNSNLKKTPKTSSYRMDLIETMDKIKQADKLYKNIPQGLHKSEYEFLDVFDKNGKFVGRVNRWVSGQIGIRHKTANAIIITPNKKVILQLRSKNKFVFPNTYSISVGGHLSYVDINSPRLSPRQTIKKEIEEELGLKVNSKRLKTLGNRNGIDNFLKVWIYCDNDTKIVFSQFDEKAKHIGVNIKTGNPSKEKLKDIENAIAQNIPMIGLKMEYWNEEICHYYTLYLTKSELKKIHFTDKEVEGLKIVDLNTMISCGHKLNNTTDSLYSLFYNRKDIANELSLSINKSKAPRSPIKTLRISG